jgi:hypothetical protein
MWAGRRYDPDYKNTPYPRHHYEDIIADTGIFGTDLPRAVRSAVSAS